ncbi:developmental regulator [Pyrenophora seminiperda CCB06]|uniref:Developmental regulator n=1 Tax=Pyrenophora seminiperda CCB06 TaxID=1302712 RepID=A0A3M7MH40_9PLEO|nr:developmental regulator [Pyrenophora seminiperda CCB06]
MDAYNPYQMRSCGYYQALPIAPPASTIGPLLPRTCSLCIRQQPKEALVTVKGREKGRKPIDPPPIIQMVVDSAADPNQQYLQNPYIFMSTSLWKVDKDEPVDCSPIESLSGTLVSSLHRLKYTDNKDGAFFVFGDISVKIPGRYRLCMALYEIAPDNAYFQHLGRILTEPFKVVMTKDFKGLDESTYLSRTFSDQGVRLRLRKEARSVGGSKRKHPDDEDAANHQVIVPHSPGYEFQQQHPPPPSIPNSAFGVPGTFLYPPMPDNSWPQWPPHPDLQ